MPKKTNKEKKIKGKAGAPKGNKNGVGHGKPANPGFDNESCIKLGKELLAWIEEVDAMPDNKKNRIIHLSQWFSEIKAITRTQWESIINRDCFRGYYERAQMWMGTRMMLNPDLPTAYGCRFQKIYFKDVARQEREDVEHKIDYEIAKKAAAGQVVDATTINQFNSLMAQLNILQSDRKSERKIEDNSIINEQ